MPPKRTVGLIIAILLIVLIAVMIRSCHSGSIDPSPEVPPAEGVVFAEDRSLGGHSL
jgi:hypothetical protein